MDNSYILRNEQLVQTKPFLLSDLRFLNKFWNIKQNLQFRKVDSKLLI